MNRLERYEDPYMRRDVVSDYSSLTSKIDFYASNQSVIDWLKGLVRQLNDTAKSNMSSSEARVKTIIDKRRIR